MTAMLTLTALCQMLGREAKEAASALARATGAQKNHWLVQAAKALKDHAEEILQANNRDANEAQHPGLTDAQLDRLRWNPQRLEETCAALRAVAALPDPIGRVLESNIRPNGMQVQKVAVPLGVILFIYESRPNVTVDAAALCVKSGNAVILRGGKEALQTNCVLHRILQDCLLEAGLPSAAVQLVTNPDREAVGQLLKQSDTIDLVIPRGGEDLIRRVVSEARMPVLKHYKGNCHVYVDRSADLDMARSIVLNAKCQRPGTCNAAESLLVHRDIAPIFLPKAGPALQMRGVELRACPESRRWLPEAVPAKEEDFSAEFLGLILSVKVVGSLEEAMAHINRYGSRHTDAIVTNDLAAARRFTADVDSAAVMVNASTRLHDGFEFGLGAEIGISTDKFHARGPCGLAELTSYKYIVYGEGQLRGEGTNDGG